MKKLFILMFIVFSFNLFSQGYTYSYYNHNLIMKNNYTKAVEDQSTNKFKVDVTLYSNMTGYVVIETGAVITLTELYASNDKTEDWHFHGIDNGNRRCNVHLNTAREQVDGTVYMNIEFKDYSFYYKLKTSYY